MAMTIDEILFEAKSLGRQQREALAEALLIEIDAGDPDAVDAAWAEEVDQRLAEFDRGEVEPVSPAEMFRHLRQKYGR